MLIKTNICSVWNCLRGNTDRQQFENDEQNVDVPPWKKFCGRPWMIVLSRFRFFVLSLITNYLFLSVLKTNKINPLLVIISSKLAAITNVMHKLLWVLHTIPNDN